MKKLALVLLLLVSPSHIWAQAFNVSENTTQETQNLQADVLTNYGELLLELGMDFLLHTPQQIKLHPLSSLAVNGYFYYNVPIKKSHFTFSPGIGISSETYSFKNNMTLARSKKNRKTIFQNAKALLANNPDVNHTSLNLKHGDLVTEIRFHANRLEPQEGFFMAIGGRIGLCFNAFTTIKYKEDNQNKERINKESFNLNRLCYGVIARLGWGRFGAFYSHTLSSFFNEQGPNQDIKPFNIGVSLNLF